MIIDANFPSTISIFNYFKPNYGDNNKLYRHIEKKIEPIDLLNKSSSELNDLHISTTRFRINFSINTFNSIFNSKLDNYNDIPIVFELSPVLYSNFNGDIVGVNVLIDNLRFIKTDRILFLLDHFCKTRNTSNYKNFAELFKKFEVIDKSDRETLTIYKDVIVTIINKINKDDISKPNDMKYKDFDIDNVYYLNDISHMYNIVKTIMTKLIITDITDFFTNANGNDIFTCILLILNTHR